MTDTDYKKKELVFLYKRILDKWTGIYNVDIASVLVVIPTNYPDAGIDCIWVSPHLTRKDGKGIPQTSAVGAGENHRHKGQEHCRWSRHWTNGQNAWKPGVSNIDTILRRLRWAFENPDADR